MLYLINIHWRRRVPAEGRPLTGKSTYPVASRNYATAEGKAKSQFLRKYGNHLQITGTKEFEDPAGIFKSVNDPPATFVRNDCGSGQHYGICHFCGKGHGTVLMTEGIPAASLVTAP